MKKILCKEIDTIIIILLGALLTIYRGYTVADFMHALDADSLLKADEAMNQLQLFMNCYAVAYIVYESIWCKKVYSMKCSWQTFIIKHMKIITGELILCMMIHAVFPSWSTTFDLISFQVWMLIITSSIAYAVYKFYVIKAIIKRK